MNESDKLHAYIPGNAMRFIRNVGGGIEENVMVERSDASDDEIELRFTLRRDSYYLRVRRDDLARLLAKDTP